MYTPHASSPSPQHPTGEIVPPPRTGDAYAPRDRGHVPQGGNSITVPISVVRMGAGEVAAATAVLTSGNLASGEYVARFENDITAYLASISKNQTDTSTVACSSGTAALHAILAGLAQRETGGRYTRRDRDGKKAKRDRTHVIVPAFSFASTATSVLMAGLKPIFVDIDPITGTISPDAVAESVTRKTLAVMGVHLYGGTFDARIIGEICDSAGAYLIEDAAQAIGAVYRGQAVGTLGDAAAFSFYATKTMTTAGEGGAVTTPLDWLAAYVRRFINHGQAYKYVHTHLGYNYRMTNLSAAVGSVQLKGLTDAILRRRHNADYYASHIAPRASLLLPCAEAPASMEQTHVFHQYALRVLSPRMREGKYARDAIQQYLGERGVQTAVHYPLAIPSQPLFVRKRRGDDIAHTFPVATGFARQVLSIPVHEHLTERERAHVADVINSIPPHVMGGD